MQNESYETIKIDRLNPRGEGVGQSSIGEISVPYTLPGEIVECEIISSKDKTWGKITSIINSSKNRTEPSCPHFGVCGGCALQHMDANTYRNFKFEQVAGALRKYGFDANIIQEPIIIGPSHRRRIDFMARMFPEGLSMGFHQINSRRRVKLEHCAIVVPEIEALFSPLRSALEKILQLREQAHIFILAASNGVDLLISGFKRDLNETEKQILEEFAKDMKLTRLSYKVKRNAKIIYEKESPYVLFAGNKIMVDPNVFLQASEKSDQCLSEIVIENLPDNSKLVVDLFCGRGTFSIPIAESGLEVHSYEGDKHAISALQNCNHPRIRADVRDLFANPLKPEELQKYDAAIINPPRSGAAKQISNIARANVQKVIYVSCNPETFANDIDALSAAESYKLTKIIPVDQFMWSPHVEVVGVIEKK